MRHQDGAFKTGKNIDIFHQCWLPEKDPTAILLIVHGLAEHSGRYMNLVNHFIPLGYAVYTLDLPGHGQSGGTRVFVSRFSDFTHTIRVYAKTIRKIHPEKPVFIVGHSMGGLISAVYLIDDPSGVSGAVFSSPGVRVPDNISPVLIFAGKVLSFLLPRIGLIGIDPNGVCRDETVVDAYVNDPLVYTGKTTARLAAEMLKAMNRVAAEAGSITLPVLVVQGGSDRLIDPEGANAFCESVGSVDKSIRIYDGFYHEVFNDPERNRVLEDVEHWIAKRL